MRVFFKHSVMSKCLDESFLYLNATLLIVMSQAFFFLFFFNIISQSVPYIMEVGTNKINADEATKTATDGSFKLFSLLITNIYIYIWLTCSLIDYSYTPTEISFFIDQKLKNNRDLVGS